MKKLLLAVFSILTVTSCIVGHLDNLLAFPEPEGRVVWELTRDDKHYDDKHYQGQIRRGAVDAQGRITHLATRAALYEIQMEEGQPRVRTISKKPEKGERLVLAPGGEVYAWLIPHPSSRGLFFVRLFNISGNKIAELNLRKPPYGFGELYLGFQGKLIVTATPLDDWEGIRGRFKFAFWKKDGTMLYDVDLNGRQMGVLDPTGEAILLLGDEKAIAFSQEGNELWRHSGKFRKAAIAQKGNLVLLNPKSLREIKEDKEIKRVLIGTPKDKQLRVREVEVPTPGVLPPGLPTQVHGLTLAADGSSAVVVGDQGRYFDIDLLKGNWQERKPLSEVLPLFDGTSDIFHSEFVNSKKTLALGIQHRTSKGTWPKCTIIITDQNGNALIRKEFPIREPTSFIPIIDVTFGSQFIIGSAQDSAVLFELKQ